MKCWHDTCNSNLSICEDTIFCPMCGDSMSVERILEIASELTHGGRLPNFVATYTPEDQYVHTITGGTSEWSECT